MKKLVSILMVLIVCSCMFVGCNFSDPTTENGTLENETFAITFCQQGENDIVKQVKKGETLTDIPNPKPKTGYTIVWNTVDFTNIDGNMTVNAIETANEYKIVLDYVIVGNFSETEIGVVFDSTYTLPVPTAEDKTFVKWVKTGTDEEVKNGTYKNEGDLYLQAVWKEDRYTARY